MKFKIMTTQSPSGKTKYYHVITESHLYVLATLSMRQAKVVVQRFVNGVSESDFDLYSSKSGSFIHWKDGTKTRLTSIKKFKQFLTTIEANPNDTFQPRLHSSNSTEQQESSGIGENVDEFNRLDDNNLRAEQASEEATSSLVHQNTNINVLSTSGDGDFLQKLEEYDRRSTEGILRCREGANSTDCELTGQMLNIRADCIELEREQLATAIRLRNLRIEQGDARIRLDNLRIKQGEIGEDQQRIRIRLNNLRIDQERIREGQEEIRDGQQEIARELEGLQESYDRTRAAYLDAEAHFKRIRPALDQLLERHHRGQLKLNANK